MPRSIDESFYYSAAWKKTRAAYIKARRGLCEDCLARGVIKAGKVVHHVVHLNADNITDPEISLSWNNLRLLCQDCHAKQHGDFVRYAFDTDGNVVKVKDIDAPR